MMKKYLPVIGIAVVLAIVAVGVWNFNLKQTPRQSTESTQNQKETRVSPSKFTFQTPKKSAHYESNTPAHGAVLAGVPINAVIDFNFDLAPSSQIKIEKDPSTGSGQADYGVGKTIIDDNKLSMRRNMDLAAADGLYTVIYEACWPDDSCHDGSFQFAIDRSIASEYQDFSGQNQVTIKLSQIMFEPQKINISKGTKVTWVNDDKVEHYINTDPHPGHSYYLEQNSKVLKSGDSYSLTFGGAGIYLYHCSAHADSMIGSLLVESI